MESRAHRAEVVQTKVVPCVVRGVALITQVSGIAVHVDELCHDVPALQQRPERALSSKVGPNCIQVLPLELSQLLTRITMVQAGASCAAFVALRPRLCLYALIERSAQRIHMATNNRLALPLKVCIHTIFHV
eukprot:5124959-Pyramimonas_sp.AAC.2